MELGWNFAAVLLGLLIYGAIYNWIVGWLKREECHRGYTALLVVGGTLVTLVGASVLIGVKYALLTLACFMASGLPMVLGSMARYMRERLEEEQEIVELTRKLRRADISFGRSWRGRGGPTPTPGRRCAGSSMTGRDRGCRRCSWGGRRWPWERTWPRCRRWSVSCRGKKRRLQMSSADLLLDLMVGLGVSSCLIVATWSVIAEWWKRVREDE